jgi:hypothetical protein
MEAGGGRRGSNPSRPTPGPSCYVDKDFEILGELWDTASKHTPHHEYHFSNA